MGRISSLLIWRNWRYWLISLMFASYSPSPSPSHSVVSSSSWSLSLLLLLLLFSLLLPSPLLYLSMVSLLPHMVVDADEKEARVDTSTRYRERTHLRMDIGIHTRRDGDRDGEHNDDGIES